MKEAVEKKNASRATHVDELLLSKCQQVTSRLLFCCCCHDIDRACLHSEWHNVDILTKLLALCFQCVYFQLFAHVRHIQMSSNNVSDWHSKCLCGRSVPASQWHSLTSLLSARSHSSPHSLSLSRSPALSARCFFIFEKVFGQIQNRNRTKKSILPLEPIHISICMNVLLLHVTSSQQ